MWKVRGGEKRREKENGTYALFTTITYKSIQLTPVFLPFFHSFFFLLPSSLLPSSFFLLPSSFKLLDLMLIPGIFERLGPDPASTLVWASEVIDMNSE